MTPSQVCLLFSMLRDVLTTAETSQSADGVLGKRPDIYRKSSYDPLCNAEVRMPYVNQFKNIS